MSNTTATNWTVELANLLEEAKNVDKNWINSINTNIISTTNDVSNTCNIYGTYNPSKQLFRSPSMKFPMAWIPTANTFTTTNTFTTANTFTAANNVRIFVPSGNGVFFPCE